MSLGKNNLDWVREYIRNQRDHHAAGGAENRLEAHQAPEIEKPG